MLPRIALCGYGRAGKDTAGAYLGEVTALKYTGSLSQIFLPLIAKELGISEEAAWEARHSNRAYWKEFGDKYRANDSARLIRESLKLGGLVVGVRDKRELLAAKDEGLLDLIIWIHREVPTDPTVTYQPSDCDIIVHNTADLDTFYERLRRLMHFAGIPVRQAAADLCAC